MSPNDDGIPPPAVGCEHWRREHRTDLCPMGHCGRCRYLERLEFPLPAPGARPEERP
jgi:hypothetical protein